jgi:exosortase
MSQRLQLHHLFPLLSLPLALALLWPTLAPLTLRWMEWDKALSHGFLVAILWIYLLLQLRPTSAPPGGWPLGLALTGLGCASVLWFLLQSLQIELLAQAALLIVLAFLYCTLLGWYNTWQAKAVLFVPVFATSLWGEFNGLLVQLSSQVVGAWVSWSGLVAHIEGNHISLPYGQIVIADGCSGLRYWVVSLAMGQILCCLNRYSTGYYWLTILLAMLLGLVANWLRIFILVLIGYFSQMQNSLLHDHETFGWLLFAAMLIPALYFAPVRRPSQPAALPLRLPRLRWISLPLLALGPLLYAYTQQLPPPQQTLLPHPLAAEGRPVAQLPLESLLPPAVLETRVQWGNIYLHAAQYQRRNPEDKLVPYLEPHWQQSLACEPWQGPSSAWGTWWRCDAQGRTLLVLRWFEVGNQRTASLITAKLLQVPARLTGVNRFAVVNLQTYCLDQCQASARDLLAQASRGSQVAAP